MTFTPARVRRSWIGPDVTRRVQSNQGGEEGVDDTAGDVVDSTGAVKGGVGAAASQSSEKKSPPVDAAAKRGDVAMRARTEESLIVGSGSSGAVVLTWKEGELWGLYVVHDALQTRLAHAKAACLHLRRFPPPNAAIAG